MRWISSKNEIHVKKLKEDDKRFWVQLTGIFFTLTQDFRLKDRKLWGPASTENSTLI